MNWIKKNIVVIVYILTIVSDLFLKLSNELDLTENQINLLKVCGAIVAILLTQAQAIVEEKFKTK